MLSNTDEPTRASKRSRPAALLAVSGNTWKPFCMTYHGAAAGCRMCTAKPMMFMTRNVRAKHSVWRCMPLKKRNRVNRHGRGTQQM